MDIHFIDRLAAHLQHPLPGLDVQMNMSPPIRGKEVVIPENVRKGAVLELLFWEENQWKLVLMKRVEDGSIHSGQISFPGGTVEPADRDWVHTALREAEEEVGIPQTEVKVLRDLTELYIPPSNFLVYPTLGYMLHRPDFTAQASEVAAILEIPLSELLDESIVGRKTVTMSGNRNFTMEVPIYTVQGQVIWGATAMMLCELIALIRGALKD